MKAIAWLKTWWGLGVVLKARGKPSPLQPAHGRSDAPMQTDHDTSQGKSGAEAKR